LNIVLKQASKGIQIQIEPSNLQNTRKKTTMVQLRIRFQNCKSKSENYTAKYNLKSIAMSMKEFI